ncbi:hypothetical protein DZF91_27050, partial [Actinomadura logoneensis]
RLLAAAASPDPSARPSADELVDAASALDLGPAPAGPAPSPYPDAPVTGGFPAVISGTGGFAIPTARVPDTAPSANPPAHPSATPSTSGPHLDAPLGTGGFPEPEPAPLVASASVAAVGAAAAVSAPSFHENGRMSGSHARHAAPANAHELAVVRGWARLLALLVIVLAGCAAVMMPVVGVAVSAVAVTVLRLTRARGGLGRLEAVGRTLLSVPYAAVFAVGVPLVVMGLAAADVELSPLGAIALGAGTGTIALWTAPGAGGARRALETAFEPLAWRPGTVAAAGLVLGVLTLGGLVAAMSFTPSLAPLYGLQSSLEATLSRLQNAVH